MSRTTTRTRTGARGPKRSRATEKRPATEQPDASWLLDDDLELAVLDKLPEDATPEEYRRAMKKTAKRAREDGHWPRGERQVGHALDADRTERDEET